MRWLRSFVLAIQFLTICPTPTVQNVQIHELRRSTMWFPLVGLLLGGFLYGVVAGLSQVVASNVAAIVALTLFTFATGGLHLDGLMDTADAIGSRYARVEALRVMKDSRVGAMGVITGILVLATKWAAITSVSALHISPFLFVPVLSRTGMVWAMNLAPAAQKESGLGQVYAKKIPLFYVLLATFLAIVIVYLTVHVLFAVLLFVVLGLITLCFTRWMHAKYGGMTGDTYGALNELVETILWVVCSMVITKH